MLFESLFTLTEEFDREGSGGLKMDYRMLRFHWKTVDRKKPFQRKTDRKLFHLLSKNALFFLPRFSFILDQPRFTFSRISIFDQKVSMNQISMNQISLPCLLFLPLDIGMWKSNLNKQSTGWLSSTGNGFEKIKFANKIFLLFTLVIAILQHFLCQKCLKVEKSINTAETVDRNQKCSVY